MAEYEKIETGLKDSYVLIPKRYGDDRGYYTTQFSSADLERLGIPNNRIEQTAQSKSKKGVVRGMHYQEDPCCQAKFVKCESGAVLDVIADLRCDSPTYKKWFSVELTPENGKILYVPRGFAHGFVALKDNTRFEYSVDNHYKPSHENGVAWNDPNMNIDWQLEKYGITDLEMSEKDKVRKTVDEVKPNFFMHKRYLVTGCKGQLGFDVVRELNSRGIYDIMALDVDDMDITDREFVRKVITEYKPEYVIHCAAYTAVDKAEENEELARKINYEGTRNISDACYEIGSKLVYISTDYVFDGKRIGYYDTESKVNPTSVYGKTKYEGELAALRNPKTFVLRTSWVFGINGNNFVKTMLGLSEKYKEIKVVDDQVGSPTYTVDLAKTICDVIETDKYGVYHTSNDGYCSWAEFASYILKDTDAKVIPVTTDEYYKPKYEDAKKKGIELHIAERPLNSKLDKMKLVRNGFNLLPEWHNAVDRYMEELNKEKVLKKDK